jgi:ElaB/YqjD/DUF883 family membrane-anchored ribosome-binding protein
MNEHEGAMPQAASKLRQNIGNLREDVGRLRDDLGGAAKDVAAVARTGAQEAGQYAREALDTAKVRGEEALEATRDTIRANPLASVGVAFGAGLVLAILWRRF